MKSPPLAFTSIPQNTFRWQSIPRNNSFDEAIFNYQKRHLDDLPETLIDVPASIIPLLGLTQYLRGAVVLTLKHTFLSVGLPSFRFVVTTSVKGPAEESKSSL